MFGDERFRDSANRADRALIRDLKIVREQLAAVPVGDARHQPKLQHLHSLIGRAIFVRYLEDRKILVPDYFEKIAAQRREWIELLNQPLATDFGDSWMRELRFLRILRSKDFTYALFDQLADDFNGDTFPVDAEERECIQQSHIERLHGFLLGNTSSQQHALFFFAYRFDVIPIELISAIYEEFYNERVGKGRSKGSHYTPPALVEFILAHTLAPDVLATKPRVLDPACGSGIFLVESFRRMVRYVWAEQGGRQVSRSQLRQILRDQIAGMDINEEAVRVAAFSLYLAFLHYQEPREINDNRRLPYLKWVSDEERERRERQKPGAQFFDVLLHANSFEVMAGKYSVEVARRFGPGSATVVVGNPPWGYPKRDDEEGRRALSETEKWCATKGFPIGDKELSQAFIHLTLEVLQDGGRAGLLVSSGVFFKHHKNSRDFRRTWLNSARLEHVVNFAHVREIFFSGPQREAKGISPFVSVVFEKRAEGPPPDNLFTYWSAKRTAVIENTQCVVLSRRDMHWLMQRDCLEDEKLWKIYWWGGHRDEALVRALYRFPRLKDLPERLPGVECLLGRGFQEANKAIPADWLGKYREIPPELFCRYGRIDSKKLRPVPERVERRGTREIYQGRRLLVGRGIKKGGVITARFETKKCCFRHSIYGIRLKHFKKWQEATLAAVYWSSMARYFYFTTSGSWGLWHDEIIQEDIGEMPICFPLDSRLRNRIVRVVEELQSLELPPDGFELAGMDSWKRLQELECQLDEAVFDLYALSSAERDLVREMCSVGLDLFYNHQQSDALREAVQPERSFGTLLDVAQAGDGLAAYLRTFLEAWNEELAPDGEFLWRVLSPPSKAPLLAVCFTTRYKGDSVPSIADNDGEAWRNLLVRLEKDSLVPAGGSRIFIDTFFRHISDREIIFIKRNERRFWTRTAAREDAESALTHLMNLEESAPEDTDERGWSIA